MLARRQSPAATPAPTGAGILRFVPSLYQVALIALLGAILVVALAPRMDTDLWWHMKVGAYIAAHHAVPSRDFMSFTFAGHPWTDHEWLAELLLIGLYNLAGLWGPVVFFAVVICAAFGLVYAVILSYGVNRPLALFVLAAAYMASTASWGPRIQMLSLLCVVLFTYLLRRFLLTRDKRLLVAFPLVMLVWTNLHGGFVLGLLVLGIWLAGEALNRWTGRQDALHVTDLQALGVTFVASFAVTIVNPNGFRQLLYPLTFVLPNAFTNVIQESGSPNFHMPVMMLFEVMLLLLVAAFAVGRPRLNWTHLLVVVAFTHLALSQARNVPLWSVVVGPLLAFYLQGAFTTLLQEHVPHLSYRRRPVSGSLAPILNLTLLLMALLAYVAIGTRYITPGAPQTAERQNYPSAAVAYLRSHTLPSHVFASYAWGGYLLWKLYPRYRPFMDSRADTLYTAAILHAYLDAYTAAPDWQSVLRRYGVQVVLVEPQAPLVQVLAENKGWQLRFHDGQSVLYALR